MSLMEQTALTLGAMIRRREVSSVEAVREALAAIEEQDDKLHAFLTLRPEEELLKEAEEIDRRIGAGERQGSLAGVPAAVKDNLCTAGLRTTCASRMLEDFVPSYDAEAVRRLKAAGVILLGKTNLDEFSMGSTTETSAFGPTKNPIDLAHVPGGSSGGSAAAVAAGLCSFALGSDTGGSIRQPAFYCGVTGCKPTYGTVSRYGLIAYASSFDQVGPITRDVSDAAAVLSILAGPDPKDATVVPREAYDFSVTGEIAGRNVALPVDYLGENLSAEVRTAVASAAEALRGAGAAVTEMSLGLSEYVVPAYYTIATAEASSNLARFDGVKYGHRAAEYKNLHELYRKSRAEGFGPEVKRRILTGTFVLSSGSYDAYYLKALRVRAKICEAFRKALLNYDYILMPTAPTTAPKLGTSLSDPLAMYLSDLYTVPANLCGLPALSIPYGTGAHGLPIGVQIIGNYQREQELLSAGYVLEKSIKEKSNAKGI